MSSRGSSSRGRGSSSRGRGSRGHGSRGHGSRDEQTLADPAGSANSREERAEEKKRLQTEQYLPIRGDLFRDFIVSLLKIARIPADQLEKLTTPEMIQRFEQAFTHPTANSSWNYEALEMLGDAILNYCIVEYLTQRFPKLMATDGSGVGTLSRLKINMVSKAVFSKCAETLHFGDYIASDLYTRRDKMSSLLEDTFEAFHGLLHILQTELDPNANRPGYLVGVGASYRSVIYLFDPMEISLRYEDLYDPKTRLKQLLERLRKGYPKFRTDQQLNAQGRIVFTTTIAIPEIREASVWGTGTGFTQAESEQQACEQALTNLKLAGHT